MNGLAARAGARAARILASAVAVGALVAGIVAGAPAPAALAQSGVEFDPGYIISDSQFYASTSMNESDIQAFLNQKRPTCRSGYTCLKDYRASTTSKPADPMCAAYTGAANEPAARIIAKVAVACGISPKVLLVMLQKEQGLITDDWPLPSQYAAAMGAGCPDTAACDPAQSGFFQQVYNSAWYLQRYSAPPGTGPGTEYTSRFNAYSDFSSYAPGKNFAILWNPNTGCGANTVYIRNQPTASLYTYTPYTPNRAALDNLGGVGDSCSSYGNRNFWDFYYNWFGNPTGVIPTGVTADRIQGNNRYETAVQISQSTTSATGGIVYVASGLDYPDGLTAAPAAVQAAGTLLLVDRAFIPDAVKAQLAALQPRLIVIVGSDASISTNVETQLATYATEGTRRDGGADRFETSRIIATNAFSSGATLAYIANGLAFPDALTAGAAAGAQHSPTILVNGQLAALDDATIQTLRDLGVTRVKIAGSTSSVSQGIQDSLNTLLGSTNVQRFGGKNRFETASLIVRDAFPTSATVYMADGNNFPDALAGATLAGTKGSALMLALQPCMTRQTAQDLIDLGTTSMIMLGSTASLGSGVGSFANCD